MTPAVDITGKTFGYLVVEGYCEKRNKQRYWRCVCICGQRREVSQGNLGRNTFSCGCRRSQKTAVRNQTHGLRKHPLYHVWWSMQQRCSNRADPAYYRYGGRGIRVCDRWQGAFGFVNFIADMGERPSVKHSLDRRDNDKGYSPDNCRWATARDQAHNMRTNVNLTVDGRTQCIAAWAEETGLKRGTIQWRIKHGWSHESAVTTPSRSW